MNFPHISIEVTERPALNHAAEGLRASIDQMIAAGAIKPGFYRIQLARRSVWSPVRIWRGFGFERRTFHFREGIYCWRALLNGAPVPLRRVWPACAWEPIGMAEYRWRLAMFRYAMRHDRSLPEASPYQPIDFARLKHDFGRA